MSKELLPLARSIQGLSRDIRDRVERLDPVTQNGEYQTLKYCGALLSLVSHTICELEDRLHPVFAKSAVNGVLREWNLEELTGGDEDEE